MLPDLLAQHVATAFARQLALADLLGERAWQLDLTAGQVTFGDDLRFPIQVLGTESHLDQTWLWAWANVQSGIPAQLLGLAEWIREFGRNHRVAELTEPTFPLNRADGHQLALIASGLTGRCYYRGPYPGGAVFFHLENVPDQPITPERAFTVINQVIAAFPVDHQRMIMSFLQQQGWQVQNGPGAVVARHPGGTEMHADFDELGRLSNLSGQIRR